MLTTKNKKLLEHLKVLVNLKTKERKIGENKMTSFDLLNSYPNLLNDLSMQLEVVEKSSVNFKELYAQRVCNQFRVLRSV